MKTGSGGPMVFELMIAIERDLLDFSKPYLRGFARLLGVREGVKVRLISGGMFDAFIASFYLTLLIAVFLIFPLILWEIYAYVKPALYPHELRVFRRCILAGSVLFVAGSVYAYVFLPLLTFLVMVWLSVIGGAEPMFTVSSFFHTVFVGVLLTGVFFMFPLAILGLVSAGLVDAEALREYWRYVVFGIFAFTAVVTPDPTPVTMTLLALPFTILYTIIVLIAGRMQRSESSH